MDRFVDIVVSARHVHLSRLDADILFGEDYEFTPRVDPTGKTQYPVAERVALTATKGRFSQMAIICPTRKETQIEISLTDARMLGLDAPVRLSGELDGSPGVKLSGPKGGITLGKGVIVARRHLHVSKPWAAHFGAAHNQNVKIRITGTGRSLIFDDVPLRVSVSDNPNTEIVLHIDTDEANAAGISVRARGEVLFD